MKTQIDSNSKASQRKRALGWILLIVFWLTVSPLVLAINSEYFSGKKYLSTRNAWLLVIFSPLSLLIALVVLAIVQYTLSWGVISYVDAGHPRPMIAISSNTITEVVIELLAAPLLLLALILGIGISIATRLGDVDSLLAVFEYGFPFLIAVAAGFLSVRTFKKMRASTCAGHRLFWTALAIEGVAVLSSLIMLAHRISYAIHHGFKDMGDTVVAKTLHLAQAYDISFLPALLLRCAWSVLPLLAGLCLMVWATRRSSTTQHPK